MFSDILNKIIEYKTITIFRHENPDGDATGSQLALREWIKDNFTDKEVYAVGEGTYDVYPYTDSVSDETIANSLAIVLDTANVERIDDQRYCKAKEIIKIDHHPDRDSYGNPRFVNPLAAATCEILTDMLFSFEGYKVSLKTAEYLYSGLLTDTLSFKTNNTTKNTFLAASRLLSLDIKPNEIAEKVFNIDYLEFKSANYIRNNHMYDDGLAYCMVDLNTQKEFGLSGSDFRNRVAELGGVKEFQIWCIFTEEENGKWRGSLRSRKAQINTVAEQFNGGGHPNAAGCRFENKEEIFVLIKLLKTLII